MGSSNTSALSADPIEDDLTDRRWSKRISLGLVALSGLILLGWIFDSTLLRSIVPGLSPMKANTALAFLLGGLALWCNQTPRSSLYRRMAQVCAGLVLLIGLLTLSEYLFGLNFGIDQVFERAVLDNQNVRMSEATAIGFSLLGLALLLLIHTDWYVSVQSFAMFDFGLGLLVFAGYLFGATSLYSVAVFNSTSLQTSIAFMSIAFALLLACSHKGLIVELRRNDLGGVMARRLLPTVLIIPLVIGWIRLQGQYLGYYGTDFGVALFAVTNIMILTIVVWWTARLLNRIDIQHKQAARQLKLYAQRMEILHHIDGGIIAAQAIPDLIEAVLKELRILIPCERITIVLVDETTHELVNFGSDLDQGHSIVAKRVPIPANIFEGFDADNTRLIKDLRLIPSGKPLAERGMVTILQVELMHNDDPIGLLNLSSSSAGFFTPEHREIAVEVANQLAIVLNQLRLSEHIQESNRQLERYAHRMEILHTIDRGIIASQDAAEIALSTFKELRTLIPCQRISLKLVDELTHELVIYAADSVKDPISINRIPLQPQMLAGFDERHTRLIDDLRLVPEQVPLAEEYLGRGLHTLFQILLVQDRTTQGIMTLASDTFGFFIPEFREIAIEVANQLAIVLKQMHLSEHIQKSNRQLERYAHRMEILHSIDQGIIAAQDVHQLIESTVKEMRSIIPCEHISVSLVDPATQELVIYAFDGAHIVSPNVTRIPLRPRLWEGFDDDNVRLFEDLRLIQEPNPVVKNLLEQNLVAFLQVRLMQDGQPVGTVNLSASVPGFFTSEYREIALEVASQLVIALKQMRMSEALQTLNNTLEHRVIHRTAQLNAAKEQVEAILNNSLDGILLVNLDLTIKKANPAFEKLFGYSLAERDSLSLLDVIDPNDAKRVSASVQIALKGNQSNTLEVLGRRKNGSRFDAELSLQHVEGDGFVSTIRDITVRKAQERQLQYHAGIQNTVADAVIVTDLEYRIQSWNKAAERIYGWRAEEVIGKQIREVLQTEFNSSQFGEEIRRVFIEDGYWTGEVIQRRRDGSNLYILSSTVLFKDANGNPFGVLAINHDISERRQAENMLRTALEREKEVGEMKTRFISVASHEFRTPLTAILLTTESVKYYRDRMTPEQVDQKLDKVHLQVEHMTSILEDVLQSARMQDNYVDFKPAQENFDAVCSDIVQEFAQRPEFADRIQYTSTIPELISAFDSRLIRQVIINLLSNALKYSTADQSVDIKLAQDNGQIILEVSDHGIGIPADELKHIFEPFHRAKNVGKISGTGLGMSITKKAVEMHGGTIHVNSEIGLGTTFTVAIPIKLA